MSHKKYDHVPLFSQYLDARIELLEMQVKKLNDIFGNFLDMDEEDVFGSPEQEDEESDDNEDEYEDDNDEDEVKEVMFCMKLHRNMSCKEAW